MHTYARLHGVAQGLFLGLMTVIEWAKDLDEPVGRDLPAHQRDTTNVYLVTSRDGRSIDDEWVYAHQPLITKGATQKDWDAGFVLPASGFVHTAKEHLLYYEVRARSTPGSPCPSSMPVVSMPRMRVCRRVSMACIMRSASPALLSSVSRRLSAIDSEG